MFHILEHSVLNGSEKYPVREPFVSLLQSSMQTYLNAMTFSDKTVYPVSSRNEQDFFNLMSVYLDAVFRPLIHTRKEIFLQEGWHYEFGEDGRPCCNGVVYSEMKGAYADVDTLLDDEMNRLLYPDTCYGFFQRRTSGAHPGAELRALHRRPQAVLPPLQCAHIPRRRDEHRRGALVSGRRIPFQIRLPRPGLRLHGSAAPDGGKDRHL